MFREERDESRFRWQDLGDVAEGRPNLGPELPVAVYRLMQYTMRDVLITDFGVDEADDLLRRSGRVAGRAFYHHVVGAGRDLPEFLSTLQAAMKTWRMGILRVEEADVDKGRFVVTVAEDLDCSGLPASDETVCAYDEGFLAGVLQAHLERPVEVREIDCWASGDRVCRFEARVEEGAPKG